MHATFCMLTCVCRQDGTAVGLKPIGNLAGSLHATAKHYPAESSPFTFGDGDGLGLHQDISVLPSLDQSHGLLQAVNSVNRLQSVPSYQSQSATSPPSYEREGWGGQGLAQSGDLPIAGIYSSMASSYNSQLGFQENVEKVQNREGGLRHLMDSQMRRDLGFSVDPVQQAKDAAFKRQVLERAQAETHVEGQDSRNAQHTVGSQLIVIAEEDEDEEETT
ncbi:hypothetical protein WJX77_001882 [Trebouxia sp. C0004]